MSKQRWQRSGENGDRAARPANESRRTARWRQKADGPVGPSKSNLRLFGGLFSLAIVISLIVAAILVLRPLPTPHLTLIAAEYRTPLIDANAFALADAAALSQSSSLFDAHPTDANSLNFEEMTALVAGLADIAPRRGWFASQPTTAIVYVTALGLAIWDENAGRAVPYILPDDFEIPTKLEGGGLGKAIPVKDLIDSLARARADQKILVLDCQRMNSLWSLGVLTNEFVESVEAELAQVDPTRRRGISVLTSCSRGEVTWVDRSVGRSVFGRFFSVGMNGAADKEGNRDGYVSLAEIETYLAKHVGDWARQRADIQTPRLVAKDDATTSDRVRLVALPWSSQPTTAAAPAADPALLDRLRAGWQDYFTLARQTPAPWRFAPQQWRLYEETLLRAESFYQAADLTATDNELSTLARRRSEIEAASPTYANDQGYSLAMDRFLRKGAEDPSTPQQALVDDLLRGENFDSIRERAGQTALIDRVPPIELYLALQLATPPPSVDRAAAARALVRRRVSAEEASLAGNAWAPEVTPWLRSHLAEADQGRRMVEDKFLAFGRSPIPVGSQQGELADDRVDAIYERASQNGRSLARALALREQLLAELPTSNQFVGRRPWGTPWQKADDEFRSATYDLFDKVVRGLARLNRRLSGNPTTKKRDDVDTEVAAIEQTVADIEESQAAFRDRIAAEMRERGRSPVPAETEIVWRRISDLLLVPVPANPEDPADSARTRVNLLARVCEPVSQAGEVPVAAAGREVGNIDRIDPVERLARTRRLAELSSEFFQVGVGLSAPSEAVDLSTVQSPAHLGAFVGNWWRQLRELAVSRQIAPDRREDLFQADTARRLMEGSVTRADVLSPTVALRRLNLADFFSWQASRAAEDFWAGQPGQNRDYFDIAATAYLERARGYHPAGEAAYASVFDRIAELRRMSGEIKVSADPSRVRFTVRDEESVRTQVDLPATLPAGIAGLAGVMQPNTLPLRTASAGEFVIGRGTSQEGTATLTAALAYRGHRASADVPIVLADDENGPTVLYKDDRGPVGHYSLRLAESEKSDLKLLFVLDCSRSMGDPAANTEPKQAKKDLLLSVLGDFANQTPRGAFATGIRLFGSQIKEENASAAYKDTVRVLDISSFDPDTFHAHTPTDDAFVGPFTPLFQALIEAKKDFDSVPNGDRQIVVISDGKDNWVDQGKRAGIPEIRDAFQGTGIKINTVGFFLNDDATQLEGIAQVTGGRFIKIDRTTNLLAELMGLTGQLNYSATSIADGGRTPDPAARLQTRPTEYELNPGFFEVRVTDSRGQKAADPFSIRVRPGDLHELIYQGRRIRYVDDQIEKGTVVKGPQGTVLQILRSRPAAKGVELVFTLFRPEEPVWQPPSLRVLVTPEGSNRTYAFQQLPPNVPRQRAPTWSLSLEDWPADARSANLVVSWSDEEKPIDLEVNQVESGGKVAEGVLMGRPRYQEPPENVRVGTTAIIKMSFDAPVRLRMTEWAMVPEGRIRQARQIYDVDSGIYTGYFALEGVERAGRVRIYQPIDAKEETRIETRFQITSPTVNAANRTGSPASP